MTDAYRVKDVRGISEAVLVLALPHYPNANQTMQLYGEQGPLRSRILPDYIPTQLIRGAHI